MKAFYLQKFKLLLLILSASAFLAYGQTAANSKKLKAQEILKQAKEAISKTVKIAEVKSFSIDYSVSEKYRRDFRGRGEEEFVTSLNTKLSWLIPDKINEKSESETLISGNFTNLQVTKTILNGDDIYEDIELFDKDGEKMTYFDTSGYRNSKADVLSSTFDIFFPITLDSTFYVSLDFEYVGLAELENKKLSVLEATSKDGKTYRIFFDEKTRLLSLMTRTWKNKEGKQFERKDFYSDYKEVSGLLAAHKIVTQDPSRQPSNSETTIKSLKVNPEFKADFFKVKK